LHTKIIQILFLHLHAYLEQNPIGEVFVDGARYILFSTEQGIQRAYKPDFSFIRKGRIAPDFDWQGDFIGAPNLAVEVISRGQSYAHQLSKIGRYLEAGSDEGWLIHPDQQLVYQHKPDGNAFRYGIDDTLESALFPNLKLALRTIFPSTT
jgi:Uma2 family endonuclease